MRDVYVIGADTIKFGKYPDNSIPDLTAMTLSGCLKDAGVEKEAIQALWFSNSGWGEYRRQVCIRAQVALRPAGIDGIPMTNIENACAGGSTAFHHAWLGVASGLYDTTLAIGAEKIYDSNQSLVFSSFLTGLDVGNLKETLSEYNKYGMTENENKAMRAHLAQYADFKHEKVKKKKTGLKGRYKKFRDSLVVGIRIGESMGYDLLKELRRLGSGDHSPFMDVYGYSARRHMEKYGSTIEQLALIASKNHGNSTLNPNAQYRFSISPEKVLADRLITWPLTRSMCAPVGDGAASAILCDKKTAERLGALDRAVKVRASILGSGRARELDEEDIGERLGKKAYSMAGLGPQDINLAEVHDATAYGELHQSEALGFCSPGEGGILAESGATAITGKIPINPSGGLESRGHPIGASGLAQIHEIVTQLRGDTGERQVERALIGLAGNGGGALGNEEAAMCIHILEAPSKRKKG